MSIRGDPDLLLCIRGQFVALELKASVKSKLRPLQEYKLQQITDAGGLACRVYPENWNQIYKVLQMMAEGTHDQSNVP